MDKFAVFGNPIQHSISPRLHNMAIKELGLDGFYGRILLQDGEKLKEIFLNLKLNGANITVPYKQNVFKICDFTDEFSKNIGVVNTIIKKRDKIYGYNTDAPGFLKSIGHLGNIKKVLILGAGGTAKALAHAFKSQNIDIQIVNRSISKAKNFNEFEFYNWQNFKPNNYDMVINSTSAGLNDNEFPMPKEMLIEILKHTKFAYDVIYNRKTPFLNLSHELNVPCKDGKDMLLFQAVLAFNLFYNNSLDEKKIEEAMRKVLDM